MKTRWQILVVDDEEVMRDSLAAWLREDGYAVDTAAGGAEAVEKAAALDYAMYFVDLKMPGGLDGIETMKQIRRLHADASVIIVTAYATVDTAVAAMKEGAQEYIVKPYNPEEISLLAERIVKVKNLQRENAILRRKLLRRYSMQDVIARNARMQEILRLCQDVSSLRSTVLIQGEGGTGKELIARAIHNTGDRAAKPFVAVPCAALEESLLETELFGCEDGARPAKPGKFEMADGGTLFLDEIGGISPKLQMDLLRAIEDRGFCRVGGGEEIRVDARVIAATRLDLKAAVAAGTFRDDLFYRLNVIEIRLPALRERREDIPLLARHFLERLAPELGKDVVGLSDGALQVLLDHDWPGNVHELENAIERGVVTCRGKVLEEEDFAFLARAGASRKVPAFPPGMSLHEMEKYLVAVTLERTGGNIKEAAAVLDIDRSTLYEKIRKYEIPR
jgi:DNA-binding NtrC family response regulator